MCKLCYEAVATKLPKIPEDKRHELLVGATCYGFGDEAQVAAQLDELAEKTDGTLYGCFAFADEQIRKNSK